MDVITYRYDVGTNAMYKSVKQEHITVLYSAVDSTVQQTVQYHTVDSTVQYSTVQYSTVLHGRQYNTVDSTVHWTVQYSTVQ